MAQHADSQQWMEGFRQAYGGLVSSAHADDDPIYASGRAVGEALRERHERAVTVSLTARQIAGREGFQDGYDGRRATQIESTYEEAYVEGMRLREEHADEVEQSLDSGPRLGSGPTS